MEDDCDAYYKNRLDAFMNVAMFSTYDIFPPTFGGAVTIFHTAKNLGELGVNVKLFLPARGKVEQLRNVEVHQQRELNDLHMLITIDKTSACMKAIARILEALKSYSDFDIIQLNEIATYPLILPLKLSAHRMVVSEHDAYTVLYYNRPDGWMRRRWRRIYILEKMGCKLSDHILTNSLPNKYVVQSLFSIPSEKVSVIPNGVDLNQFSNSLNNGQDVRSTYHLDDKPIVLFLGTLQWAPNLDAVKLILTKIYPYVKQRLPEAVFMFVGPKPPKWLLDRRSDGLIVTGCVSRDILCSYINAADVCIAPLISGFGSGTRLKLLEYMACQKPIVSTSLAAEGLHVRHGVNIMIEDDLKRFAERILELTRDEKLASFLGKNARMLVEEMYDWRQIAMRLRSLYTTLA